MKHFDGCGVLVPCTHAISDVSVFPTLGSILSFGFPTSAILPTKIAFPTICGALLGPMTPVNTDIIMDTFIDYLSVLESSLLHKAILISKNNKLFLKEFQDSLINLLGRFRAPQIPSSSNITRLVV